MKRYILTGAPGSGKTSVIRRLETLGHSVIEEAATDVIALEQTLGVEEPWAHPQFIDQIVALQRQRQEQSASVVAEVQFFDRSPVDTYALCLYLGFQPSHALMEELDRIQTQGIYNNTAFFMENLGFCQPTEARRITFEESLRFEQIHEEAFKHWDYEIVKVPPVSISERARTILNLVA